MAATLQQKARCPDRLLGKLGVGMLLGDHPQAMHVMKLTASRITFVGAACFYMMIFQASCCSSSTV